MATNISDTNRRKVAAHYIYTPQGLLEKRVITIESGVIVAIEQVERVDEQEGVEFYSGILMPGMVNAHTHLELSYLRGAIASGGGFAEFASGMSAQRGLFSEEQMAEAAEYHNARMWAEGVAAVGDVSNSGLSFEIKKQSKIDYHTFVEAYGLRDGVVEAARKLYNKARAEGLRASTTPHSTYSLNEAEFGAVVGAEGEHQGGDDAILSIHFMESLGERELYEGRGEMKRWYDKSGFATDFTHRYASPTERIIESIPAHRRTMLVHNTHVTQRETERLQAHFGENLTWVLCPRSNRYINNQTPPFEMLAQSGARVAIGTDSLASNTSLSMIEELKMLPRLPLEQLLKWATLCGAQALGMDGRLGSLEVGKSPGVVLLEGVDWDSMTLRAEATTRRLM